MSQSCDLENDTIQDVILAQVLDWPTAYAEEVNRGSEAVKSTRLRKGLIAGNIPSLSLLHNHLEHPELEWSVVDFHRIFVLPKALVSSVSGSAGPV